MGDYKVNFSETLQNSQELGTDDEYMFSSVTYTLEKDGQTYGPFNAVLVYSLFKKPSQSQNRNFRGSRTRFIAASWEIFGG